MTDTTQTETPPKASTPYTDAYGRTWKDEPANLVVGADGQGGWQLGWERWYRNREGDNDMDVEFFGDRYMSYHEAEDARVAHAGKMHCE